MIRHRPFTEKKQKELRADNNRAQGFNMAKKREKKIAKPGMFNVYEHYNWLVG